jgi:hypothetical protein
MWSENRDRGKSPLTAAFSALRNSHLKSPCARTPEIQLQSPTAKFPFLGTGRLVRQTGCRALSSIPSSSTTHSGFLPSFGDLPNVPAIGGLFLCALPVSRSPGLSGGRFRGSVSAPKIPVPGAEKMWRREVRL